jgi:hypothetical protein
MARDSDRLAGSFETENTGGFMSGFLAEEDDFDRRSLWRLGSWAVGAIAAVVVALMANQSSIGVRREHVAAADLARQSLQIQSVAKESQNETRRLASAIDTLNGDRDRLYSRMTVLEQGLDSVTGSIARQNSASASPQAAPVLPATTASAKSDPPSSAPAPAPAPAVAPVASAPAPRTMAVPDKPPPVITAAEPSPASAAMAGQTAANTPTANTPPAPPATPLMASKSMMAPPDAAAGKLIAAEAPPESAATPPAPEVIAAAPPADEANADDAASSAVQRTEFGVDVGTANSVGGLRNLWRGLLKSKSNSALAALRPIIVVKEGNSGMQLRLVAGPLGDAAAAAKICAAMLEHRKPCETTVFDGQQLAMRDEDIAAPARPASTRPAARHRGLAKRVTNEEPPKPPETTTTMSSFFGRR